jgi:glycosyltransferase involved in cell wall biosynthesis
MIALLHGATSAGAVERYVEAIAKGLRDRERPAVLVYPDVPELAFLAKAAGGAVDAEPFPAELLEQGPRMVTELTGILRRRRVRVAHVAEVWPQANVAARLTRVTRLLLTHHTPELRRRDNLMGRVWQRAGWLARPDVIYTSKTDRATDNRRLLRTHVVPLGIDLERFTRAPKTPSADQPVIGNVARLAEQKGQRTLLEAAPTVLERYPAARFVIVGDGELRDALEAAARDLGIVDHVTFTGARDDVPELLATFDVFAFPSHFEGLCLAVIEAQAAGVPVVATPVGGIRETVVDRDTGLLVPVERPDALAAAILDVLDDPDAARRRVELAQARVLETFAESTMVERTIELYGAS